MHVSGQTAFLRFSTTTNKNGESVFHVNSLSEQEDQLPRKMAGNKVIMLLMAMIILKVEGSRQSDVEEIIAQASRLQQAYGARDMETLTSLYTDDCRLILPGQPPIIGRAGTPLSAIIDI